MKISRSQAQIEAQLLLRWEQVERGVLSKDEAFGKLEDWTLILGKRRALLHTDWRQWLWYDHLHDEWVFAECGIAEGILVVAESLGGVKKLPYFDKVENWYILLQQGQPLGLLRLEEATCRLENQNLQPGIFLWTPLRTEWLPASKPLIEGLLQEKEHLSGR